MWKTALVAIALSLFMVRPAAASKSWDAVKKSVSPKAAIVFGGDGAAIRGTTSYGTLLKMLLDEEHDAKQAFEMIEQACGINVPDTITDFTVVMQKDERPLVVLGLDKDERALLACLDQIVATMGGDGAKAPKVVAKKKGKITEYSMPGESDKLYLAWLAKDVVAFTDDPSDKARLSSMLSGRAAKGDLGKFLGKVSTAAPLWGAVAIKQVDRDMGTLLGGYGQVEIKGANLVGAVHLVMAKAAEASHAAEEIEKGLGEIKAQAAKDPMLRRLFDSIKVGTSGNLIDLSGSVPDKDAIQVFQKLDHVM